jgi:hypothetical protein
LTADIIFYKLPDPDSDSDYVVFKVKSLDHWPGARILLLPCPPLYIFDPHSGCFCGNPENPLTNIPFLNTIFALAQKVPVHQALSFHRDLLEIEEIEEDDRLSNKLTIIPLRVPKKPQGWKRCFHGTSLRAVESIIRDGLLVPGTVTSGGIVIHVLPNHIQMGQSHDGIENFAKAIFVSPLLGVACNPAYVDSLSRGDQNESSLENEDYVVLECVIDKYHISRQALSAIGFYIDPELLMVDNILEWRIEDIRFLMIRKVLILKPDHIKEICYIYDQKYTEKLKSGKIKW